MSLLRPLVAFTAALAASAGSLICVAAGQDPGLARVTIVVSSHELTNPSEVTALLQGELAAAGFRSDIVVGVASAVRKVAEASDSLAAIGWLSGPDGHHEIWLSDRAHDQVVVKRVVMSQSTSTDARLLAFSAVDLLHATLAEVWTARAEDAAAPVGAAPAVTLTDRRDDDDARARELEPSTLTIAAGTTSLLRSGSLLWGGAFGVSRPLREGIALTAQAGVDAGALDLSKSIEGATATVVLGTVTSSLSVVTRPRVVRAHAGVGVRAGMLLASATTPDPTRFQALSTTAPWVAPTAEVGGEAAVGRRIGMGLTIAFGYAVVAPVGSLPRDGGVDFGGAWLGARLSVEVK